MKLTEARGKLVAVGGAEDRKGDCVILKEFIRMAKGAKARIVIMTTATNEPKEMAAEYKAAFKRLGVDEVQAVDVSRREDAFSEAAIETVRHATGLYFSGGDQLHVTSLMGGTPLHALIHERYGKGLVIGGTSAGAAMMSNSMIISGDAEEPPKLEGVQLGPGMDLLVGTVIDTHFSQRGRHGRLITVVAHYPQDLGLGIDENTAMLVDKGEFEVIGEGSVTVIDGGTMSYSNLPYTEEGRVLSLHGITLHVLSAGDRFDLRNRKPIEPKSTFRKAKAAQSSKESKS